MNWRKKVKASGFELSSYSKKIQASANQLENLELQKKKLIESLKTVPEEEMEEIGDDILKLEETIEELDSNLCSNIEKYDNNREKYKVLGDKLKASREAKKQPTQPQVQPQPELQPQVQSQVQSQVQPQAQPQQVQTQDVEKKNKSGLILAGALLVVGSIIGINLLRKK
jgi:chromosome segregation ATPase